MTGIVIYTNSAIHCPYCIRAKQALTDLNYVFEERDIVDPAIRDELLAVRPSARTVPQIFITDYHIGGCDDLLFLIKEDRLAIIVELNS